jgi:hypothetical protein
MPSAFPIRLSDLSPVPHMESRGLRLMWISIASPEDILLGKPDWYRQGGQISEQQWNDVLGLLKVQHIFLDWEYIQQWAEKLGLTDLLANAMNEAGVQNIAGDAASRRGCFDIQAKGRRALDLFSAKNHVQFRYNRPNSLEELKQRVTAK